MTFLTRILNNNRGGTAIEYALVASLISVAAIVGYENLGGGIESKYSTIDQKLGNAI
jgi:Flp pilus assembly pilin Flp